MLPSSDPFSSFEPAAPPGRRAAILLVEDDNSLGDLLVDLLGRSGIHAQHATDGTSALRILSEQGAAIELAFVDCQLPDMEGGALCRALRASIPGLPLLLTSGRDQRALFNALSADGRTAFLQKPYMPADVLRHVNALLSLPA